jgi:hypothetical protein
MRRTGKTLDDLVLVAAAEIAGGDMSRDFAAEHLLVQVWKHEPEAFGLRGYEREHPDANKLYTKTDGKKGLVARGLLEKSGERRFRLTRAGLDTALRSEDAPDPTLQAKLSRKLQDDMAALVSHSEFQAWLRDANSPTRFRSAGLFWGIAPGSPAETVYQRVHDVDRLLDEAQRMLEQTGQQAIASQRGKQLFDGTDIERAREFQAALKARFARELRTLDPDHTY